jgi:MFS transporter, SP family, sugar:H+ symporter
MYSSEVPWHDDFDVSANNQVKYHSKQNTWLTKDSLSFQYWTSIGTLVGTVIDNFASKMDGKRSYIIPLGIVYIVPGILMLGMFLIPESPRWLLQQGKTEKARKSLRWLRPKLLEIDNEFAEMQASLELETQSQSGVGIIDLFRDPVDRRRTILSVCAVTIQAASGAMYVIGESSACAATAMFEGA